MTASLKEPVKSVPKELARRGLSDGVERLRMQLRETAQDGRTDDSGDRLEDTASGGLRRAERGVEQLLKQKKERPTERQESMGTEPESPPHTGAEHPRIKTKEAVQVEPPHSTTADMRQSQHDTTSRPIKTRETAQAELRSNAVGSGQADPIRPSSRIRETVPVGGESPRVGSTAPAIKTKDTYIQRQTTASSAGTPQVGAIGRVGARGQAAAKEGELPRRGHAGAAATEPAPMDSLLGGTARSPDQRVIPAPKAVRESGVAMVQRSRRRSDTPQEVCHTTLCPMVKESRQTVKATEQRARQVVKTAGTPPRAIGAAGRKAGYAGRQTASSMQSMTRTRQAAQATKATAQKAAQAAGRALRAILSAVRGLAAAVTAGGGIVFMMIMVICLIGLLIASPFGLFFSGEDNGTDYTMPDAVVLLNGEFSSRIEQIKANNPYDTLDMDNAGSAAMISNWDNVLAIYAVRTATDDTAPDEVATLTVEKLSVLRQIFWDMNAISYWVEVIPGGEDEDDTTILHITVTVKNYLQMADEYGFTTKQRELLAEMMGPEYQELFMALTGSYRDLTLTPEQVREIIENLPNHLSEERRQVVLTAYQLLGKVNYFWGGKSLILGWDSRWGTPMEVWAEGSSTTGSVRPFGMDCSGFTDWVFYNVSGGKYILGHGGGASAQHSYCTEISWEEAIPGDLVFYPGDEHVGIVCGFDADGNILVIHCAYSANNVVVTGKSGFTSIGRPTYYTD